LASGSNYNKLFRLIFCNVVYVDYYSFTLVPNNGPSRSYFVEAGAGLLPVNDLPADDFVLLVEDARGCQQSHPFSITQPDPIVVNHSKTDISCFGAGDGAITISVDGGRGAGVGYNYLWHKVDDATFSRTTKDVSGLESGTYYVEVAEMIFSNCPAVSSQIIIHEPSEINVMVNAFDVKTCHGDNSGRLEVSVNGGTAPYLVAYANNFGLGSNASGNGPGFVFNNLVADDYIVTVTDNSGTGCSITAPVETIVEPAVLVINTFDYSIDCDPLIVNSGLLEFEISGGVEVAGETRERRVERMHAQNVPLPGLLETLFRIQREWLMSSKLWAKFLVFVQNRAKKTPLKTLDPAEERALMNTIYNRDYILRGILREYDSEQMWLREVKKLQGESPLVAPTIVIGAEPKKEVWGTGWIDALEHYVQELEVDAPARLVRIRGKHMLMRDKPGKLAKAIRADV